MDMEVPKFVLDELKSRRLSKGLSLTDVSSALGVGVRVMSEYERGIRVCRADFLFSWCRYLGVRLGVVVTE